MTAHASRWDGADGGRDPWLEDFSLLLKPDAIHSLRRKPDFEAFTGSKFRAYPWLVLVAAVGGALGGILTSASLWSRWWQAPIWLLALVLFGFTVRRVVVARCVPPLGFLAGWCLFFGLHIGAFTMWGAQLSSTAWCYGITGGLVFFLLGITGGLIEAPNGKPNEDWFMTSSAMAPLGSCLAAWIYRNLLPDPGDLTSAALTGTLAALPFLSVTIGLHLLAWRPERALIKLASLYLHNDSFAGEARPLLDTALKADPSNAFLLSRRGLAHALAGDWAKAEADWAMAAQLSPRARGIEMARGWAKLRGGDAAAALTAFGAALPPKKRDRAALVGIALAHRRLGSSGAALEALKQVPGKAHDALSLTYLAEAYLATGNAERAMEAATTAIEEADSIHGRSWIARAEAHRGLGDIDGAAEDYNRALWAADEIGVSERALAGLEEIERPISEDEPDW